MTGPLNVEMFFYFAKPKSAPKHRLYPSVKPDATNVGKAVEDALNGVVWDDDAQIVDLQLRKRYGVPQIVVTVQSMDTEFIVNTRS